MRVLSLIVLALGPLLFACSDPPVVRATRVRELGAIADAPTVKARDGGYSARWDDRSVWLFGDTVLSLAGTASTTIRDLLSRDRRLGG